MYIIYKFTLFTAKSSKKISKLLWHSLNHMQDIFNLTEVIKVFCDNWLNFLLQSKGLRLFRLCPPTPQYNPIQERHCRDQRQFPHRLFLGAVQKQGKVEVRLVPEKIPHTSAMPCSWQIQLHTKRRRSIRNQVSQPLKLVFMLWSVR